jgi:hypothetical protein
MNDLRSRNRITRAIDLLQIESDAHHSEILRLSAQARPDLVGPLLHHSRTIDLLERHQRELRELLDHPPRLGSDGRARSIPGPTGDLGPPTGMRLVAA